VHYGIGSDGRFSQIRVGSFGEATKNDAANLEKERMAARRSAADT
jgi:hypothetical protein